MEIKKDTVLKRFYFVRHGQTMSNITFEYQGKDSSLNEKGKEQALFVAERFATIPADIIISSDYLRTRQTTEIIVSKTGLSFCESPLFQEIRRPSDIIGKKRPDLEAKKIMDKIIENETQKDWHYSDEENLFDALTRSRKALEYLRSLPEEKIIIVTHEAFTKMLLSAMMITDDTDAVKFYRMMRGFMTGDNTGITIVEYGHFHNNRHYRLRIWNDHAHLG